jgi:hypothetical protein
MKPETVQSFEGFIKGDLAESIVSRLLRKLGYHVRYNGIEVTHPDLLFFTQMNLIGKEKTLHLAYQSDFLVTRIKDERYLEGLNLPVEVKYRRNGKISSRELLPYADNVQFIFLDCESFWSLSRAQLGNSIENTQSTIRFSSLTPLECDKTFNFSDEERHLIIAYKSYVKIIDKISVDSEAE